MFDVPFRYGGPWTREADAKLEQVVVLSEAMNDRLFGGRNSVGQTLRIEDREFRVVGVLAGWQPSVRDVRHDAEPAESSPSRSTCRSAWWCR